MVISGCLKQAGHQTLVVVGDGIGDFERIIRQEQPDIIAFSLMSGLHLWANDVTAKIRGLDLGYRPFIIYGGPHPTFFPEIITKADVDAVCIGEGEFPMVDLASAIGRGERPTDIANLHIKDANGVVHRNPVRTLGSLDDQPFPDRDIYYRYDFFRGYPTKSFMTGRGCPYNCTFCYNKTIRDIYDDKGKFVRMRSPEHVIAEILDVKKKYGLRTVYFFDDTFGIQKSWARTFLKMYKEQVGLPFLCRVRANTTNEEFIAALKDAGCVTVSFAIETANEGLREKLLRKKITDKQIYQTAALLRKYGIKFFTYNMVGIPEQSMDDIFDTIRLNIEIGTSYPWCSIFHPYPGTELAQYCIEKGYLPADFDPDHLATSFHSSATISDGTCSATEITNIHKLFQLAIYFPPLLPIVRWMSRRQPNPLFSLIFMGVYFINFVRSEQLDLKSALVLAYRNVGLMLGRKRKSA